jgi:4-hydroxy-2-oxoglutarate aldolase
MTDKLSGIFAPISTPFVDEEISLEMMRENMQKYRESPLTGLFALGSNGENKSMTEDEKLKIFETIIDGKAGHQVIMAGTGCESTRETIAFSKKVAAMGADYVSVITPSYFKKQMTDEAMVAFYTDIAEALTIPVVVYNAPGFTGVTLSPKVINSLAGHPNIAGMKDSSAGNMSSYMQACGDAAFSVLSGTISTLFTALVLGASGGVVSLANAFPEPPCELYEKFMSCDIEEARNLHYKLFALNRSVSGSYGVAGVKYAMQLGGFFGGKPRRPLLPLKTEEKESIKAAVRAAGL